MATPALVVLTPVKNEAWILERFLAVTSRLADLILIADQGSSDESRAICARFPKVELLENTDPSYDEAARQRLLIDAARRRVPGPRVLLALDADEILAADAERAPGWAALKAAPPGTVLLFEKPDLFGSTARAVRYRTPWPLGYADDGAPHLARRVHSLRVPVPEGAPRLAVEGVHVLHYALTRLDHQAAKARFYCVQENLHRSSPLFRRRLAYSHRRDWSADGTLADSLPEWFEGWERAGIDMHTISRETWYWQDFDVLRAFARHGTRRFWLDDLWQPDWEACRRAGIARGEAGLPAGPVRRPPFWAPPAGAALDAAYRAFRALKRGAGRR